MINKRFLSLLLISLFLFSIGYSVENIKKDNKKEKSDFFKELLNDHKDIWLSPFHYKFKDWILTAGIVGVTSYLIANDESIYSRIKAYQGKNPWISDISPKMTLLGDGTLNLGISGLFFLSGAILRDSNTKNTGKLILMGLVHSGIVVQLLKHLSGRQRPEAEGGIDKWEGPAAFFKRYKNHRDMFYDSFPSGHTITIWTTATIIAHQYNSSPVIPILSYSIAALSGFSRVTEDKHWLSDVFVGAVLGFAIGKFVYRKRSNKFSVYPYVVKRSIGLTLGLKL